MDVLRSATNFWSRTALVAQGARVKYGELLDSAASLATVIKKAPEVTQKPLEQHVGPRVAIMAPPGRHYVEATWGTWLAGGTAVPLCLSHPAKELQYFIDDSEASVVLATPEYAELLRPLAAASGAALHVLDGSGHGPSTGFMAVEGVLQDDMEERGSVIVYTSGTTGRPKGALHTHGSVSAATRQLCLAWEWQAEDRILHALPLHHVHGMLNALHCAHYAGACVEFMPKFSPAGVWERLARQEDSVTVFMGVPTMYSFLLNYYDKMSPQEQQQARESAARLRLTVSGSAACPIPIMKRWKELSGRDLLERYGMTEIFMGLSNPLDGERRPGAVGQPLPWVEAKAVAEDGSEDGPGELLIKGPNVFKEYWRRPDATAESFDSDGYFRTGDTAVRDGEPPYWRILGRTSVDIIKSAGYKISALGIENVLLTHPDIGECAVVGIPDETYGEVIGLVVGQKPGAEPVTLAGIQTFLADKLPPYQAPKRLEVVPEIPRNAMGKINKKQLVKDVFPTAPS